MLLNPPAHESAPGGDGEREEEDNDDGTSDVEGGEEDGMGYSRLRKQQVSISCSGQCGHALQCAMHCAPCTWLVHHIRCVCRAAVCTYVMVSAVVTFAPTLHFDLLDSKPAMMLQRRRIGRLSKPTVRMVRKEWLSGCAHYVDTPHNMLVCS